MSLYTHQTSNKRKTFLLFSLFLIIVIGVGWGISYAYGNPIILYIAVAFAVFVNIISYWYSSKIVLKMAKARPIEKKDNPELYNIVENLCITAGLPMPKVYYIDEDQPNAFATGRNPEHSVIAVTRGLLERLNRSELEGVIAHELSHIGNRDMLVSTAAVILVGFVSIISDIFMRSIFFRAFFGGGDDRRGSPVVMLIGIAIAILAPVGAVLIKLAISRKREFLADSSGALLTRYPEGLASALEKISSSHTPMKRSARNTTAHLWIDDPFKGKQKKGFMRKLFMTHPPVEERISALKGME